MTAPLRIPPVGKLIVPGNRFYVSDLPFGANIQRLECGEGATIAEMAAAIDEASPVFTDMGFAKVGEQIVPKEIWHIAKPKAGMTVVFGVRLGLGGGAGGASRTKQTLAIVASIAIIAATIWVGGGGLGFLGPFFAAGAWGARIAAAAVGLLGSAALSQLTKPKTAGAAADIAAPEAASLSGNALEPGGRLPRVIGGPRRIAPMIVQGPLSTTQELDEYVTAIFALAGPHLMENIRLGDSLVSGMEGVEVETRAGIPGDMQQTLVPYQSVETYPSVTLIAHSTDPSTKADLTNQDSPEDCLPKWVRFTTRPSPDEVRLQLIFPEGLWDQDDAARFTQFPMRFRFRQVGDSAWINGPEVWWSNHATNSFRREVRFFFQTEISKYGSVAGVAPAEAGPVKKFWKTVVPVHNTGSIWTADSSFSNSATINDTKNVRLSQYAVEIFLDPAVFSMGQWEIEVLRGWPSHNGVFTDYSDWNGGSSGVLFFDYFGYDNVSFVYVAGSGPGDYFKSSVVVSKFSQVRYENPIPLYGEDATISIRIRNRAAEALTVEATGLIPTYDDGTGDWIGLNPSNDPADNFRDILTGSLNGLPLPADLCDDAAILAWKDNCDDQYFPRTVSAVAEGGSVWEALGLCAAAGNGGIRGSDFWGPTFERDRSDEVPVQVFTPRNSSNFSSAQAFDRNPDCLIVNYEDAADEWRRAQAVVYFDGFDAVTNPPKIIETTRYDFTDNTLQVTDSATIDLRSRRLRSMIHSFDADPEGLVCRAGDLIGRQDDILRQHAGFARIVSISESGGLVLGLTLDAEVPVINGDPFWSVTDIWAVGEEFWNLGESSGMTIRLTDNALITAALDGATESTRVVTFVTPFTNPGATLLEGFDEDAGTEGCLVVVGPLGTEYERFVVASVQMGKDMMATLSVVDEAPEILLGVAA